MSTESERAYVAINDLIRQGAFTAGDPLRESSIARQVGVSRTPVREALRRMAAEGTVEFEPNRGATLALLSPSDVDNIFDLRALLEPYGARLAAERRTEEHLDRLEDLYARMAIEEAVNDLDSISVLNTEFHGVILAAAEAPIVRDAVAMVTRRSLVRSTFGRYTPQQHVRSQQHHRDLIDAVRARNGSWAESTMRAHIEAGREAYERNS
jgi:DNA-binding GntR family transcriptional regulator